MIVGDIPIGNRAPLVLISGLNVLESRATALECAHAIRDIALGHGIPFIFKASFDKANRSQPDAFRGPGLIFEELHDYVPGDDVRWIEWNATARLGRPIIKRMREERDLVLALIVDLSDSLDFGYGAHTKRDAVRRAAAALATAAIRARDRVALASFSNGLLETLPPATGPLQLVRVLYALEHPGDRGPTQAQPAFAWAADTLPRHSVIVVLSDLLFSDPGEALRRCARKHDLSLLRLLDPADTRPVRSAPVRVRSAEGGRTSVWGAPQRFAGSVSDEKLRALGADVGGLWTGPRLIPSLQRFLERHARGPR